MTALSGDGLASALVWVLVWVADNISALLFDRSYNNLLSSLFDCCLCFYYDVKKLVGNGNDFQNFFAFENRLHMIIVHDDDFKLVF